MVDEMKMSMRVNSENKDTGRTWKNVAAMFEYGGLGRVVVLERMLIDERNKIRENHV